jgi:hypothetical protein
MLADDLVQDRVFRSAAHEGAADDLPMTSH